MIKVKKENSHDNYKYNKSYFKDFVDFMERIKKIYSSLSESIYEILNKKYIIFGNSSNIFYSLMINLKAHMQTQYIEYKGLSNFLAKEIIEPYKIFQTNNDKNEESLIKELNDANKKLKKAKTKYEENKHIFLTKMKETEKLILEEKSMKINTITSNQEIKDKKNIAFSSICDSMKYEDNYTNSLQEVNKLIEEINKIDKELYKFYEETEEKTLNKIKDNLFFFMATIKATNSKINSDIDDINKKFSDIKLENEIKSLLEKNKYILSEQKKIDFQPYVPFTSLSNSIKSSSQCEEMNINYEVIVDLQRFFKDICINLDMDEEKRRKRLRDLCLRIFDDNQQNYVKDDHDELMKYMEKVDYRNYFISALTHQRLNGKYKREEKLFNELLELLNNILECAKKEKNFDTVRNCIILSQTFYKEKNEDGNIKKIYLMEYIKKDKWLSSPQFWKEYIEEEIAKDKIKFEEESKKKDKGKNMGDVTNVYFSKLITYSHNMNMFSIEKKDAFDIINYFIEKYSISETMKSTVIANLEVVYGEKKQEESEEIKKNENAQKDNKNEIIENNNIINNNEIKDNNIEIKNENNNRIKKDESHNKNENENKIQKDNNNEIKNENNNIINNEINKINNEVKNDNNNIINIEIKNNNNNENKNESNEIISNENKIEMNDENKNEIKDENNNEIKDENKNEIKDAIKNENRDENTNDNKDENRNEIKDEDKNEIMDENKIENKNEIKKEIKNETIIEIKNESKDNIRNEIMNKNNIKNEIIIEDNINIKKDIIMKNKKGIDNEIINEKNNIINENNNIIKEFKDNITTEKNNIIKEDKDNDEIKNEINNNNKINIVIKNENKSAKNELKSNINNNIIDEHKKNDEIKENEKKGNNKEEDKVKDKEKDNKEDEKKISDDWVIADDVEYIL